MKNNLKKKLLAGILATSMVATLALTGCGGGGGEATSDSAGGEAAAPAEASGDAVVLHFASTQSQTAHVWGIDAEKFKETVESESNGSLEIQIDFGGVLGNDKDIAEGVQNGTIDMYIGSTVGFDTIVPAIGYTNLPYFINSYETADELIFGPSGTGDGWVGENMKKNAEANGFHCFGITMTDFRWLSNSSKPIESAADIKNMKMRVPEAPMFLKFFENLGAIPTAMGITEVPSALQTKTIDGQDNGPMISYPNGFHEFNKYWTKSNHSFASAVVVMNQAKWDSLSAEQQDILTNAFDTYIKATNEDLRAEVDKTEKAMIDSGCEVIEASEQLSKEMQEAAYKVWQDEDVTKNFDQEAVDRMLTEAGLK